MNNCGKILRILAILAAILLCIAFIGNYSLDAEELKEDREDLEERIDDHDESHEGVYASDRDDCETCESLDDQEKSLDRQKSQLVFYLLQSIGLYSLVYCGMLFALGEIAAKAGQSKVVPVSVSAPAPAPAPAAAPAVCPNCGAPKQAGSRFCGTCGSVF